jgi:hypothetical protein
MTHSKDIPHNHGQLVLTCAEETRKDQCTNPAKHTSQPDDVAQTNSKQYDVANLYLTDEEMSQHTCLPFLQNISFAGPKGEVI